MYSLQPQRFPLTGASAHNQHASDGPNRRCRRGQFAGPRRDLMNESHGTAGNAVIVRSHKATMKWTHAAIGLGLVLLGSRVGLLFGYAAPMWDAVEHVAAVEAIGRALARITRIRLYALRDLVVGAHRLVNVQMRSKSEPAAAEPRLGHHAIAADRS